MSCNSPETSAPGGRIRSSTFRAPSWSLRLTSHLGLSGSRSIRISISVAGAAAIARDTRQEKCWLAPMMVETTMPTPMPTWNVRTSCPRRFAGASSATYIGMVWVAPPTAKPSTTRLSDSAQVVGASEQASAPTMNITETSSIVRCRPHCSESRLHASAPITAPSRMLEAMICSTSVPVWNWRAIWSRAPEMIPVS